jgi:NADPH:quinone reductase-like Zn-dependent oxidoreductase
LNSTKRRFELHQFHVQFLIRARCWCALLSAVNPLDLKIRAGAAAHPRHPLPAILGLDLAGTVEATGEDVTRFRRGDEVYGMTGGVGGQQGSLAEFAAIDADLLARKSADVTMREAAGLIDRARSRPGQSVLVQGGSGGVGHMAIQIARALGATVFATGAPSRRTIIERLAQPSAIAQSLSLTMSRG